jgi:hypothetical protein
MKKKSLGKNEQILIKIEGTDANFTLATLTGNSKNDLPEKTCCLFNF